MNIHTIATEDISNLKNQVEKHLSNYLNEINGEWIKDSLGHNPFKTIDGKTIPEDFALDMSEPPANRGKTDATNAIRLHQVLQLSDSQAADERIWTGLCFGPFWNYSQYRWTNNSRTSDLNGVRYHFFVGYPGKRGLMRQSISRLWWAARLTYDETNTEDPYTLTRYFCNSADVHQHIFERNTSNNKYIIRPFLYAIRDYEIKHSHDSVDEFGAVINTDVFGELAKRLQLYGGTHILDCLDYQTIYDKTTAWIVDLMK